MRGICRVKLFECDNCGQPLYFENTRCEQCGHALGYSTEKPPRCFLSNPMGMRGAWLLSREPRAPGLCANAVYEACNWLVPDDSAETLCLACRHNRNHSLICRTPRNLVRFRKLELAKHRLFYSFLRWGLPLANRSDDPQRGLAFDILAEVEGAPPIMTGHADGIITISAVEAEGAERERRRTHMGESYRTLLGHFRHETGHYFWDAFVSGGARLDEFRALFGDERRDYGAALEAHYRDGPPADWQQHFISAYATTHPWEDFAETWAHLLHIVDTLETAAAFGIAVHPSVAAAPASENDAGFDPYRALAIEPLIDRWLPLTFAVNSLNRSMGQPDLYPFVLSATAMQKLAFVRSLIQDAGETRPKATTARP